MSASRLTRRAATMATALALTAASVEAQWVTTHEQFYLQASHNWQFRDRYQAADRLFNAFDFGHAILYETLLTRPGASVAELEQKWFDRLTKDILIKPPRVPLEEAAIEVEYAKLVPEAKAMFEWAHILHRQIYDILADERLSPATRDSEIERLLGYYRTRRDVAFSSRPKSMDLMEGQPYSLAFRKKYPKFNGLIWAYHWLQVGLYEPLMLYDTPETRQAGVRATVARFWQMLDSAPAHVPYVMPMTPAVAPTFAARYPEAAIIFDNLHSMHDVVSDILANPTVPRNRKRAEILRAAERFRDDTSYVMTPAAWREMASHMGLENMGGPAVGFLAALPTPTVAYGAVMTHGAARPAADPHAGHVMPTAPPVAPSVSDSSAVVDVVARYHAALASADSMGALGLLTDDAVVLESGGAETLAEYRTHHLPADIAFAAAVPSQRAVTSVVVRGDLAWVASTSTSQGEFRGRAVNSAGAELMVLSRTAAGWKISAIHWSSRARRP